MGHVEPKQHQQEHDQPDRQAQLELKIAAWRADARHHGSGEEQAAKKTANMRRIVDFDAGKSASEIDAETDQ